MKPNDIVLVKGEEKLGIVVSKYKNNKFDWEVVCLKGRFSTSCKQDCYYEADLKSYKWKAYPKTLLQKLKILFKLGED